MEGDITTHIIFFIILLLLDLYFYGFGVAVKLLNETEIEKKVEEKDKKSIKLKRIIQESGQYINTVQLSNTLIHVIIGALNFKMLSEGVEKGIRNLTDNTLNWNWFPIQAVIVIGNLLATAFLLYLIMTIGILLPKKLASRNPEKWAYFCVNPVYLVLKIFLPLTNLVNVTTKAILFLFGMKENQNENDVTEEEIISMVNEGHEQGVIQASEAEMISNIFELGEKEAQDIMTHRNNIIAIDCEMTLIEVIRFLLDGKNSRYPVFEDNIDHIIGILNFKDAMKFFDSSENKDIPIKDIPGLMREPEYVTQTKNIDELFREMQAKKVQMAIVVDEYGQTDGLVAMEDILEEIVGNILDEYDDELQHIEEKGEDEYIVEGMTLLEELENRFEITFEDEPFETLNGFLISRLDRIPEEDECFDVDYQGFNFKILEVKNKMIQSVLVTRLPEIIENIEEEASKEQESDD